MFIHWRASIAALALAGALAACGSQASSGSPATPTPSLPPAPTTSAPPTPTPSAPPAPGASPVVLAHTVGSNGTILVAASNMMTVYTFTSDSPGVSACKGGCATVWPPLTVPAGTSPTGGSGVTGALATITRDDGGLQVTYKGLPLYFFHNDAKPGDTKGHYSGWNLVTP